MVIAVVLDGLVMSQENQKATLWKHGVKITPQ